MSTTKTKATLTFAEIDTNIGHEERGLFALGANKSLKDVPIQLNDVRSGNRIVHGPEGLDVQGFAYLKHHSRLQDGNQWSIGHKIEEIYYDEVCDLVCKTTGAKKAAIVNCAFRRNAPNLLRDPTFYVKRDSEIDKVISSVPRDIPTIIDRQEPYQIEPITLVHVDYTELGLYNTIRECRKDITALAKATITSEDARDESSASSSARYAAYLVWRPLKPVKRNPLTVADYRTVNPGDLSKHMYRCASEQNSSGEYLMEYWNHDAPKDPEQAQWYFMPEQGVEDVLVVKLADSHAEEAVGGVKGVARCSPHAAAIVKGQEGEEPRESLECRVVAFWE